MFPVKPEASDHTIFSILRGNIAHGVFFVRTHDVDDSCVFQMFQIPRFIALHLVEVQLIVRVDLGHIWKIPSAKLIHQRLGSRGRVELSLLVEVSLRRILQYAVSHLQISQFLCTLLLFNPCLQICKDIIHVVEAVICSLVILSVIVGLRLSVIISAASHLLNYSFFKSWELFDCR